MSLLFSPAATTTKRGRFGRNYGRSPYQKYAVTISRSQSGRPDGRDPVSDLGGSTKVLDPAGAARWSTSNIRETIKPEQRRSEPDGFRTVRLVWQKKWKQNGQQEPPCSQSNRIHGARTSASVGCADDLARTRQLLVCSAAVISMLTMRPTTSVRDVERFRTQAPRPR
jgi:hypothetical protein